MVPSTSTCMPFLNWLVEMVSAMMVRPSAGRDQLLRVAGEALAAVPGDHDEILDPHPADARQVDARLHCDDHALLEGCVVGDGQARILVDLETDAVTGAVLEVLSVAGLGDDVANDRVGVRSGDAGTHRVEAGQLGPQHQLVDLAQLI